VKFETVKRNRYRECIETGLTRDEWLAQDDAPLRKHNVHVFKGREYSLPHPYNRNVKGAGTEKKTIYDCNMKYMKRVCRELVAIDVGRMAAGGWNMDGFPDAMGSCEGIPFYCEFKRPGGKVSSAQVGHLARWIEEGHASIIVASPDGFYRWHLRERPIGNVAGIPVY
jgi:hypothetical protein